MLEWLNLTGTASGDAMAAEVAHHCRKVRSIADI